MPENSPRLCPNCRALVSAEESECPQCGAVLGKRATRPSVSGSVSGRAAGLMRAVALRPTHYTVAIIVLCVIVYVWMTFSGGAADLALVSFGALLNRRVDAGEWWRLVTPIFLHVPSGGIPLHLLVNMYAVWSFGPVVEKFYGSAKFVVFFILTGIAGNVAMYFAVRPGAQVGTLASFLIRNADVPSAGASGALFGLVGVLMVLGIKHRNELPEGFARTVGTGLVPMLLINLGIGFAARAYIGNAAHLGGLVSGFALAWLVDLERPTASPVLKAVWKGAQGLALALVAVSFFMLWRHYQPAPTAGAVNAFMVSINQGRRAVINCLNQDDPDKIDKAELAKSAGDLKAPQRLSPSADALSNDLLGLVRRCEDLAAAKDSATAQRNYTALNQDFKAWDKRSDAWVDTEGVEFNLQRDDSDSAKPPTK